jgi:acetyl esterase/lipase
MKARGVLALLLLSGLNASAPAFAQPAAPAPTAKLKADAELPEGLRHDSYRLWPGRAPNARGDTPAETPTLTVFRPQFVRNNMPAVVIAPGGGYLHLASELEGTEPAAWFAARGITAFVLTYRVGLAGRLPTPLWDGARAIRYVRTHAADFQIDANRIGMMGFSAGGHLAAMTGVQTGGGRADDPDPVERQSSRPDFLILAYPWLQAVAIRADGHSQYCDFAKATKTDCNPPDYSAFMPAPLVDEHTPPTFIYHTSNDELVPAAGSAEFFEALIAHHVPAELHSFEVGHHGSGLGGASSALSRWPELLDAWMRARGLLDPN